MDYSISSEEETLTTGTFHHIKQKKEKLQQCAKYAQAGAFVATRS